jgi:crotonobetainyl-CoA:carnitine CoA-transferase CaiB-like acyl-CoA transferase
MSGALDGICVIDFGQYLAGPLAALQLADRGAEVIRVDPPGGPRWRHPANAV